MRADRGRRQRKETEEDVGRERERRGERMWWREMRSEDEALRVSLLHPLTRVPQLCLFCTSNSLSTYCYKNDILV